VILKKAILSGNEAIARGFLEAGGRLAAAYPGTPSTEVLETLSKAKDIHAEWSVNEKVAMEVAIGGAISGVRSMACMKHVGVNVASDPLMTVAYTGVNAGLVLMAADDPGMFSSQNEQDTRHFARTGKIPCLEPSDSAEARQLRRPLSSFLSHLTLRLFCARQLGYRTARAWWKQGSLNLRPAAALPATSVNM